MLSSMKLVIFSYLWLMVSSRELPPAMADVVEAYVAAQKGEKDDLRDAAMSLRKALKDQPEEVKMAVLEALKLPTDLINDVTSRPENPETPLQLRVPYGTVAEVEALCILGSSLNPKDDSQYASPVVMAASKGKKAMVDVFLRFGANLYDSDRLGKTALHFAVIRLHPEVIMTLNAYSRGSSDWLDLQDDFGDTALHAAARAGLTDTAKLLVKLGAEKNLQNEDGRSPLDLAVANAHKDTAEELKEMGCRETYFKGVRDLARGTKKMLQEGPLAYMIGKGDQAW